MKLALSLTFAAALALTAAPARAEAGPRSPAAQSVGARAGVAVVAPGAPPSAWALAQAVYAEPALRPASLDEAHARVLAGEAPTADPDLRELAELREGVRGDDAASRTILALLADRVGVTHLLVVMGAPAAPPVARLFSAASQRFESASFAPDDPSAPAPAWLRAVPSIAKMVAPASPAPSLPAPALALAAAPLPAPKSAESRVSGPFYLSGWFWGVVGAAAFSAGAVYFATRDNSGGQIHLQLQLPQ